MWLGRGYIYIEKHGILDTGIGHMNYRIDEAIKEQIRSRADIAAIIGRYVNLKGSGQTLKGLCPFHKEKTPSFHVNPVKGFFHCFGCGKGGDVFSFLQEIEGFGFPEALKLLAEETGVELSPSLVQRPSSISNEHQLSKTDMLHINEIAAKFYYNCIRHSQEAIGYFKSRGLAAETVRDFRLGFSPSGWSSLIMHFQSQGIGLPALISCGLAIQKEGGGAYDRFRNRVMFSLFDISGKVIGFAGRGMEPDATPKYLNSPETLLYKKKNTLYGLYHARQYIKECGFVMIVEGYMDYLTMYQAGIRNVVATSGTALTEEHAHLLQRFTTRIVLLFDGDLPGQTAAVRGVFVLAPFNFDVSVLVLPGDEDPDSYIKKFGADSFNEQVKGSRDWMDFIIEKMMLEHDAKTPRGKSAAIAALQPLVQALKDSIVQQKFKKEIAEHLGLDEKLVYDRINELQTSYVKEPVSGYEQNTSQVTGFVSNNGYMQNHNFSSRTDFPKKFGYRQKFGYKKEVGNQFLQGQQLLHSDERYLGTLEGSFLRIIITKPELIAEARQYVVPETLTDNISGDIYSLLIETFEQGGNVADISIKTTDPEIKRIISLLLVKPAREDHIHDELVQKIIHLRAKFLRTMIKNVKVQMKNEPQRRAELLLQLKDFTSQLQELDEGE